MKTLITSFILVFMYSCEGYRVSTSPVTQQQAVVPCTIPVPTVYTPVCGTDGATYSNREALECSTQGRVKEAYPGECGALELACLVPLDDNPICGTDSVTYLNVEAMECRNKKDPTRNRVRLAHRGACTVRSSPDACPLTGNYDPVCGSDGQTYTNLESLKCAAKANPVLHIAYSGECRDEIDFSLSVSPQK